MNKQFIMDFFSDSVFCKDVPANNVYACLAMGSELKHPDGNNFLLSKGEQKLIRKFADDSGYTDSFPCDEQKPPVISLNKELLILLMLILVL